MDADRARDPGTLPLSGARRVNASCERFEAAWRAGLRPWIEDYLGEEIEPVRSTLLAELLALELELREERGERPAPQEYRARFPGQDCVIDSAYRRPRPGTQRLDGPSTWGRPGGRWEARAVVDRGQIRGPCRCRSTRGGRRPRSLHLQA